MGWHIACLKFMPGQRTGEAGSRQAAAVTSFLSATKGLARLRQRTYSLEVLQRAAHGHDVAILQPRPAPQAQGLDRCIAPAGCRERVHTALASHTNIYNVNSNNTLLMTSRADNNRRQLCHACPLCHACHAVPPDPGTRCCLYTQHFPTAHPTDLLLQEPLQMVVRNDVMPTQVLNPKAQ